MTIAPRRERLPLSSLGKFWTIPNVLSLVRMVLVIPVFYLLVTDGPVTWILVLVFIAIATDWFDGRVARWSNAVSEWGKILDPIADKVAAAGVVLALVLRGTLPVWFLVVIVVRDVIIVLGGMYLAPRVKHVVMSMWWGKVAITVLAITGVLGILRADEDVLLVSVWITTVLLLYSFGEYVVRFVRLARAANRRERDLTGSDGEQLPEESGVDAPPRT